MQNTYLHRCGYATLSLIKASTPRFCRAIAACSFLQVLVNQQSRYQGQRHLRPALDITPRCFATLALVRNTGGSSNTAASDGDVNRTAPAQCTCAGECHAQRTAVHWRHIRAAAAHSARRSAAGSARACTQAVLVQRARGHRLMCHLRLESNLGPHRPIVACNTTTHQPRTDYTAVSWCLHAAGAESERITETAPNAAAW